MKRRTSRIPEKDCAEVGLTEKSNPTAVTEIENRIYRGGNINETLGQRPKTG